LDMLLGRYRYRNGGSAAQADSRCDRVTDVKPTTFHGRTLVEIPDITAPELRRANLLLSYGCRNEAEQLLDTYIANHPTDFRVAFLQARLAWTAGDPNEAAKIVSEVLSEHPDFDSAQLLKASLLLDRQRFDEPATEIATLLNSLSLRSPTNLWVYMDGLRLEALRAPTPSLRDTLLEITKDADFPPSAREAAFDSGRRLPNLSRDQSEAFYWANLEYESATPMPCKVSALAFMLSEDGGRYEPAHCWSPRRRKARIASERNPTGFCWLRRISWKRRT
jgi:tetratricopeptide (TPR) repeat protein